MIERGKGSGYNKENKFLGPHKAADRFKNIGENQHVEEYKSIGQVEQFLHGARDCSYYGYINIYVKDPVRKMLCDEFFAQIYTADELLGGGASPNKHKRRMVDQDLRTLPAGLKEKRRGDFFQIFWNCNIESCSGTHFDQNDSLLCMIQGKKTVELAPKDSPHMMRWGGDKDVYWSRMAPTELEPGNFATLDLYPGEALFLPEGVWHRVWSAPDSMAFSFGTTHNDLSEVNRRLARDVREWKRASRAADP